MLTEYGRKRARFLLGASGIWIVTHEELAAPCDLCPPTKRVATRTSIVGTRTRNQPYRICYKCMGKLHLKREREFRTLERSLYLPMTTRRERARQREQQ